MSFRIACHSPLSYKTLQGDTSGVRALGSESVSVSELKLLNRDVLIVLLVEKRQKAQLSNLESLMLLRLQTTARTKQLVHSCS